MKKYLTVFLFLAGMYAANRCTAGEPNKPFLPQTDQIVVRCKGFLGGKHYAKAQLFGSAIGVDDSFDCYFGGGTVLDALFPDGSTATEWSVSDRDTSSSSWHHLQDVWFFLPYQKQTVWTSDIVIPDLHLHL